MNYNDIAFPGPGILLRGVGQYIDLGGFHIMYYGIMIAIGFALALTVSMRYARSIGVDPENVMDFLMITLIPGILGARAYYVIFSWDYYKNQSFIEMINLRHGGLGVVGGLMVGFLFLVAFCRKRKIKIPVMLDITSMGILTGQIIGRWGNFFNREAFGGYTEGFTAMQIPVEFFKIRGRTGELVSSGLMDHLVTVTSGGRETQVIQVHPTFLYEGMWNLMLLLILFLYRKNKAFDGELFAMYMFGYGIGRFFIESLRVDQLQVGKTGIPATQIVCILLICGALIWEVVGRRQAKKGKV